MAVKMKNTSAKVDAYIRKQPAFARPILTHLRELFHKASPKIEETIKWGVPHFEYKGLVGGIAAFKKHVSFGLWKSKLLKDPAGLFSSGAKASMCNAKFSDLSELPADKVLVAYIKEAVKLNEKDVKLPSASTTKNGTKKKKTLTVPTDLKKALAKNARARKTFDGFSYTNRKEYVEWITSAKKQETRDRRLAQAVEWMADGKPRNWKYQNC